MKKMVICGVALGAATLVSFAAGTADAQGRRRAAPEPSWMAKVAGAAPQRNVTFHERKDASAGQVTYAADLYFETALANGVVRILDTRTLDCAAHSSRVNRRVQFDASGREVSRDPGDAAFTKQGPYSTWAQEFAAYCTGDWSAFKPADAASMAEARRALAG